MISRTTFRAFRGAAILCMLSYPEPVIDDLIMKQQVK